jgi:hypothetical protein
VIFFLHFYDFNKQKLHLANSTWFNLSQSLLFFTKFQIGKNLQTFSSSYIFVFTFMPSCGQYGGTQMFFFIYSRILIICANVGRRCSNNWRTQISQHILFGILAKLFDLLNVSFYTADILYWEMVCKVCLFVDHLDSTLQQYQFTRQLLSLYSNVMY